MPSPNSLALPLSVGVHVLVGVAVATTMGAPPPRAVQPPAPLQLDMSEPIDVESLVVPSADERLPLAAISKPQAVGVETKTVAGPLTATEGTIGGESVDAPSAPVKEGGATVSTAAPRTIDLGLDGGVFRATLDSMNRSTRGHDAPLVAEAKPTAELRDGLRAVLGRVTDWARRRGPREGQTEVSIQCSAGTTARVRLLRAASNEGVWSEFIGALGADGTLCNPRLLEGHSETELILRVTLTQRTPGGSSFVGSPGARAEGWVDERFREKTSTLLLTFDVDPSDLGQNKVTHADVALLREILR